MRWQYCGGLEFYQRDRDRVDVFNFETGRVGHAWVEEDGKCYLDTDEEIPLFVVNQLALMLALDKKVMS